VEIDHRAYPFRHSAGGGRGRRPIAVGETSAGRPGCLAAGRPLRVGVLVDLALAAAAGGHVKCWQRLAEAAVDRADDLDLTVHFQGPRPQLIALSPAVRYVLLPPVFSTARLVRDVPDHTDLAPWHPRLARALAGYDVIHTTDAFFCYARTAERFARRRGIPVVSSIHTNTPEYARITAAQVFARALGPGPAWVVNDLFAVPGRIGALLERRLGRHLASAASAMRRYGEMPDPAAPGRHCGIVLRRGLDRARFAPGRRDRAWFEARFALPPGRFVAMYAGKLNVGKNVPLLAAVVARARQEGVPVQLFCAGSGPERQTLERALGAALTCAGALAQDELARAYASADLFLFPSTIDESGNAAVEALASGLPALLAAGSGVASLMAGCGGLRVLPGDDPAPWAAALVELAAAPRRRAAMRRAARAYVEAHVPNWAEVLEQDLVPVWRAAARLDAACSRPAS
jgi:glycosyltransferase involved in cell wall biosynthesis